MSILKIASGALLVFISASSFANIGKLSNSKTVPLSSEWSMNTSLLLPSAKNPDPMLAQGGGLANNHADCPFKSQIAKSSDSNGKSSGRNNLLQTAHSDTGNR